MNGIRDGDLMTCERYRVVWFVLFAVITRRFVSTSFPAKKNWSALSYKTLTFEHIYSRTRRISQKKNIILFDYTILSKFLPKTPKLFLNFLLKNTMVVTVSILLLPLLDSVMPHFLNEIKRYMIQIFTQGF